MSDDPEEVARQDAARHLAAIDVAIAQANPRRLKNGRKITLQPVTFLCEWCGQPGTEMHYPGNPPRYHEGTCKREAKNSLAAGLMRRRRAAEREAAGLARRPRGRPPKG